MLVLTLRTDNPTAEIGLYDKEKEVDTYSWEAHRQLAETLHTTLEQLLKDNGKTWDDIEGIVCFQGPGSFTGLRIGMSVANALAHSLSIPAVAAAGLSWQLDGIRRLESGESDAVLLPEYGGEIHITKQKK